MFSNSASSHFRKTPWWFFVRRADAELFHLLDEGLRASKGRDSFSWKSCHDDRLRSLVRTNQTSCQWKYPFDCNDRFGNVRPIYAAVALGASADVVELICRACPDSLMDRSACGWTALHTACSLGASLEVVQVLTRHCPSALAERDIKKQTPLHAACESVRADSSVIEYLVTMRPELLKETACSSGVYGQLPLHVACGFAAPFESVKLILQSHPKAAKEADMDGRIPLHLAVCHYLHKVQNLHTSVFDRASPVDSLKVVRLLLEEHPWAVKTKGGRKWGTPLELASNKRITNMRSFLHSLMAVNDLIDCDPLSEDFADIVTYFKEIGWTRGHAITLEVHPNYLHHTNFDIKGVPHLLAKFGRYDNLRAVSSIVKCMPMLFESNR